MSIKLFNVAEWIPYEGASNLNREVIHIFKVRVDEHYKHVESLYKKILSEKELLKAQRYVNKKDTERYIVSKYSLRKILSDLMSIAPNLIKFGVSFNKKPVIDDIEFNVSHSGNYVIIVTSPVPVGIDIEFINDNFDFTLLLSPCFNSKEASYILNSSNPSLNFYTLWTRKEAILKASGEGLTDDMYRIDSLDTHTKHNDTTYHLTSFSPDVNYLVSFATNTNNLPINFWEYTAFV